MLPLPPRRCAPLLSCLLFAAPAFAQDGEDPPPSDDSAEEESAREESSEEPPEEDPPKGDEDPEAMEAETPPEEEVPPEEAVEPIPQEIVEEPESIEAPVEAAMDEPTEAEAEEPKKRKLKFSDFMSTTLTFYIGDDNVLAGNKDGSPNLGMGNDYPELFFEGLNSENPQVVSESHLVVYAHSPGYLPFVDTEAAFVAEFELSRDPDDNKLIGRFQDDGSYVAATFWFNREKTGKNVRFTAWPYSADRFRLGYTYDLTWGGKRIFARNRRPAPGMKLNVDLERFYFFVGAKSLVSLRADNNETENYWGVLGGLGSNVELPIGDRTARLSYDLGGGYFGRGTYQQDPFRSVTLKAFGMSHRVMFTVNHRMGSSPDLKLLVNDPESREDVTNVPSWTGAFGFGVSGEFTTIWSSLINADAPNEEVLDDAITGAVSAQVRFLKNMRVGVDVVYRDVSFLVFNVPGLIPYLSFAQETIQTPQVYGAGWVDFYIEKAHLTPSFIFGLMQPASFQAAEVGGERQTEVIREANDYEIMPTGQEPFTILSLKASLKWGLSDILTVIGEVSFVNDFNVSKVVADDDGATGRVLDRPRAQALGLNFIVQARF
jgi:hypothetical protein